MIISMFNHALDILSNFVCKVLNTFISFLIGKLAYIVTGGGSSSVCNYARTQRAENMQYKRFENVI